MKDALSLSDRILLEVVGQEKFDAICESEYREYRANVIKRARRRARRRLLRAVLDLF